MVQTKALVWTKLKKQYFSFSQSLVNLELLFLRKVKSRPGFYPVDVSRKHTGDIIIMGLQFSSLPLCFSSPLAFWWLRTINVLQAGFLTSVFDGLLLWLVPLLTGNSAWRSFVLLCNLTLSQCFGEYLICCLSCYFSPEALRLPFLKGLLEAGGVSRWSECCMLRCKYR